MTAAPAGLAEALSIYGYMLIDVNRTRSGSKKRVRSTTAEPPMQPVDLPGVMDNLQDEVLASLIRLPLAAVLGAVLALRPQRRGTPDRQQAVIQTQILLAVIGAFIMLIVGSSLARAFAVVATATLIRYDGQVRSPKDAVVMLSALAAGLACGVGLYWLAVIGTVFVAVCLWMIEGFEQHTRVFELTVKLGDNTQVLRSRVEGVLKRFKTVYELRTIEVDATSYLVTAPRTFDTDQVSHALRELAPGSGGSIEWDEKKKAKLPK